jgi:exoribonuclease R
MDRQVKSSHDMVAHWMIIMNSMCGDFMYTNKFGIFRTSAYMNKIKNENVESCSNIKTETKRVIRMWNNSSGQYIKYDTDAEVEHELMQVKSYIHITSPIRRIVDLLNQLMLFKHLGLIKNMSENAREFMEDWLSQMDYLNTSMRSIRKVQTDCEMIHRCFTDPEIMKKEHTGVVFDKVKKGDDVYCYMVYLEDVKLLSKVICRVDLDNYSENRFKMFLFEDEDKIKKKIRLYLLQ